jgi:hypothetical protein
MMKQVKVYAYLVGNDNMNIPIPSTWIGSLGWGHWGEGMGTLQVSKDWSIEALGGKSCNLFLNMDG